MKKGLVLFSLLLFATIVFSQDGNAGINEANTKVRSYFASGTNLMYAVGAVLGLEVQLFLALHYFRKIIDT